jgi:C-terminal processing protease CtpA/Prc
MNRFFYLTLCLSLISLSFFSQSIDDPFSRKNMKKDLTVFKNIRLKVNSGLYKYRTKKEIDSIYKWAEGEIEKSNTYLDFFNIINKLTDFEGSTHNSTQLPKKKYKSLSKETSGYFPFPLKQIEGKMIINFKTKKIPLGAEILSINSENMTDILQNMYKYYTVDGFNITGKSVGINYRFSKYYRFIYGLKDSFKVIYKTKKSQKKQTITLKSIGFKAYYTNFDKRYSLPFDELSNRDLKLTEKYWYKNINQTTGLLTINTFAIGGNAESPEHKVYLKFLDSVFIALKNNKISNLIVDVRRNGGGTDPNDLVTYSYLTNRNFSENKQAWISFHKIPYLKYVDTKVPLIFRPIGVIKYNKYFKTNFPTEKVGKFYQNSSSEDHKIRTPNKNAFTDNIYLLISPEIASAGSLFASMVAGNKNTVVIGEETTGGYYGHNGHTPLAYVLPKSKIKTIFSIVNLEQDVIAKKTQIYGRGVIPDYHITQTFDDFLNQADTQLNFVFDLIKKEN